MEPPRSVNILIMERGGTSFGRLTVTLFRTTMIIATKRYLKIDPVHNPPHHVIWNVTPWLRLMRKVAMVSGGRSKEKMC